MKIPLSKLFAYQPKIEEAIEDVYQGKLSYSTGKPILVSRLDYPVGGFFLMDGHHRAIETLQAGGKHLEGEIAKDLPRIERTGGAFYDMVDKKVQISSLKLKGIKA